MRGFPGRVKHPVRGDRGVLAAVSGWVEGISRGLRVSPSGACVCARARSLELGQQQRALLEWCCAGLGALES